MPGAYTMTVRAALSLVRIRMMRSAVVIEGYDCVETVTKLTKIRRFVSFVSVLNRIPVRYEQAIAINGSALAPDVTALSRRQEEFIWEHCGRTGIVPWKI